MPLKLDSLNKLYAHELKDLHSAESQVLELLPRVIDAVDDDDLRKAFEDHMEETERHVSRLEKVFDRTEFESGGHHCKGMEGLLKEVKDVLNASDIDPDVRDAALIAAIQRVEHYEIAGYGVARTYAEKLGDYKAADLLQKTLNEEGAANQHLSRLAERKINFEALVA